MMIDTPLLLRAAGYSAMVAIVALIGSGITIALFFGGAGAVFGPANDLLVSATTVALILPVLGVDRVAGEGVPWLRLVSIAAVAGLILIAVGQVLLVVGVIDLGASFVTGGLGVLPVFAWVVALVLIALGPGLVGPTVGWLAAAVLVLSAATAIVSALTTGPVLWVACVALLLALTAWLATVATDLLGRAAAA